MGWKITNRQTGEVYESDAGRAREVVERYADKHGGRAEWDAERTPVPPERLTMTYGLRFDNMPSLPE